MNETPDWGLLEDERVVEAIEIACRKHKRFNPHLDYRDLQQTARLWVGSHPDSVKPYLERDEECEGDGGNGVALLSSRIYARMKGRLSGDSDWGRRVTPYVEGEVACGEV